MLEAGPHGIIPANLPPFPQQAVLADLNPEEGGRKKIRRNKQVKSTIFTKYLYKLMKIEHGRAAFSVKPIFGMSSISFTCLLHNFFLHADLASVGPTKILTKNSNKN